MLAELDSERSAVYQICCRLAGVSISLLLAGLVTLALIYLEQSLIDTGRNELADAGSIQMIDFVRIKQQPQLEVKKRKPKPPPVPDEMPELLPTPKLDLANNASLDWTVSSLQEFKPELDGSSGFSLSEGGYLPLVKVEPIYPMKALQRGLAGWVLVEFTVTKSGSIRNPIVVSNCAVLQTTEAVPECVDQPNKVFDKAAIIAALKFKYKPRVVSGEAIATGGVRNKITFVLDG